MRIHIPTGGLGSRTYCGQVVGLIMKHTSSVETGQVKPPPGTVVAIDLRMTCIEDATCRRCQRSDDRRVAERYRREQAALPEKERDGYCDELRAREIFPD